MNLPYLQGHCDQSDFFIYAAADARYFELYGRSLINSVKRNTDFGVHIHLYDPTDAQIEWCRSQPKVSITWENLTSDQFSSAEEFWSRVDLPEPFASRKSKMLGLKQFRDNTNLDLWIRKTYYACMRFVRLAEFLQQPQRFLQIDIDGLVRSSFPITFDDDALRDIYLYEKKKGGHLAGAILFTDKPRALEFIRDFAGCIRQNIERDNIYWFLDQHCLDDTIRNFRKGLLPITYIDWHMQPGSAIWSAKGRRKDLQIFQDEIGRYL